MDERFNPYWFGLILLAFLLAVIGVDCTAPPTLPAPTEAATETSTAIQEPTGTGTPTASPAPPTLTQTPYPFPTPTRLPSLPVPQATVVGGGRPAFDARVREGLKLNIRDGDTYALTNTLSSGDWLACYEFADSIAGRTARAGGWCRINPPENNEWVILEWNGEPTLEIAHDYRFEKETDEPNSN